MMSTYVVTCDLIIRGSNYDDLYMRAESHSKMGEDFRLVVGYGDAAYHSRCPRPEVESGKPDSYPSDSPAHMRQYTAAKNPADL